VAHALDRVLGLVVTCLLTGCHTGLSPATPASVLPLRSLKLYETGVGYFERSGRLNADGSMTLPVPTSHLDDALKTLVVMGEGRSATLTGVEFSSSLSRGMARSLAGLPASADTRSPFPQLLDSLKGSEVEIRLKGGDRVEGRLVEVVAPAESTASSDEDTKSKAPEKPSLSLLVVTRDGEFRRLDAAEVAGVRPTDPNLVARGGRGARRPERAQYADASRAAAPRRQREALTIGYLAETPIWRATYRLVLDADGGRGFLQGWALVHNDTDEPWERVKSSS